MRRRLTIAVLVVVLMLPALAASAWTAFFMTCHGCYRVYQAPGIAWCATGDTWHIKSRTWDFGPLDSTGTTTFQWVDGNGNASTKNFSGEHDGVTRTWNTGDRGLDWGSVYYFNLWSGGSARADIYCN